MQMIMELLKELFLLTFGIFVTGLILKLFFKHTLLGKIIAVIVIDTWLFIKWCLKLVRNSGKFVYKTGKVMNKRLQDKDKNVKVNKQSKKVVNSNNIIDFNSAKQLRHKWNK
jgi:uncharacterized protein YacL